METQDFAQDLINYFNLDTKSLSFDRDISLNINDNLEVHIEKDPTHSNIYFIYAPLELVQKEEDRFYIKLLQSNHFCKNTGNGAIGYSKSLDQFYLFESFNINKIDFNTFLKKLQNFILTFEAFYDKL